MTNTAHIALIGPDAKVYWLNDVVHHINKCVRGYHDAAGNVSYGDQPDIVVENIGKKYIRIVSLRGGRSVYCFLDFKGNIYKAASWKAPAKHVRGSVFDENCSWGKGLGPYGAAYL